MAKAIIKIFAFLLLLNQNISCQMKKEIPEFQVEICHPDNKYDISPIEDKIFTLENIPAGLPYGDTSGRRGDSGSTWTEQHGTPIGTDNGENITMTAGMNMTSTV